MKRKIGTIYNKPIVTGDKNLVTKNEIHESTLKGGGTVENSDLNSYLDNVYDYYCTNKIIGLSEDGKGNLPYSDLNVEMIEYTDDDLKSIKELRSAIFIIGVEGMNPLLYDNTIIEVDFQKYTCDVFVNTVPDNNKFGQIFYIKCRKVNKYSMVGLFPDEIINIIPEYASFIDVFNVSVGKETPLIKITAEDYYKGQYFINKSTTINQ